MVEPTTTYVFFFFAMYGLVNKDGLMFWNYDYGKTVDFHITMQWQLSPVCGSASEQNMGFVFIIYFFMPYEVVTTLIPLKTMTFITQM